MRALFQRVALVHALTPTLSRGERERGLVHPFASASIISAAFSAIIKVGELVLPEVIRGITEASAMRRPARPRTYKRTSTTAIGSSSRPIFAVPTGWKIV